MAQRPMDWAGTACWKVEFPENSNAAATRVPKRRELRERTGFLSELLATFLLVDDWKAKLGMQKKKRKRRRSWTDGTTGLNRTELSIQSVQCSAVNEW